MIFRSVSSGCLRPWLLGLLVLSAARVPAQSCPQLSPNCAAPPANVEAWWSGDVGSGPMTSGDLLQAHELQLFNGALAGASGQVGSGLSFDGVDDYAATTGPVLGTAGQFTVEGWIRLMATPTGLMSIVSETGDTPNPGSGRFTLRITPAQGLQIVRVTGSGNSGSGAQTGSLLPLGTWTHVAAVYAGGSTFRLYINGLQASTTPVSLSLAQVGPIRVHVGSLNAVQEFFPGDIDELALYRRALRQEEIQAIVASGAFGKCKGPAPAPADIVGWWSGDTLCAGAQVLDTAQRNSATALGGVTSESGLVNGSLRFTSGRRAPFGRPLLDSSGPFTVEAWVRQDSASGTQVIMAEMGDPAGGTREGDFNFRLISGSLSFYRNRASGTTVDNLYVSNQPIVPGVWSHVAAVYVGGTDLRVYLNGQLHGTNNGPPSVASDSQLRQTVIGARNVGSASPFRGRIDELTLYRRALSLQEINAIYRASFWGKCRAGFVPVACLPGTEEDIALETLVNGSGVPRTPQKSVTTGDQVAIRFLSPGGGLDWQPVALFGQLHAASVAPSGIAGLAGFHLDAAGVVILFDGVAPGPLGSPPVLPPGGTTLGFLVPPGLAGHRIRLQAAVFGPLAANGFFAGSPAHQLTIE